MAGKHEGASCGRRRGYPSTASEDERRLFERLDGELVRWAHSLTDGEREALRTYQATDRTYRLINGVRRGRIDPGSLAPRDAELVARVGRDLDFAVAKARLLSGARVYRGVRDILDALGIVQPELLVGTHRELLGFTSTSVFRSVALEEFVRPGRGALLEVDVPAGTNAAWLPLVGHDRLRYQGELLIRDRIRILVKERRVDRDLLVLVCEIVR